MTNKRRLWNAAVRALVYAAAALTVLLLVGILGYVLYRGLPNVTPALLTQSDSVLKGTMGIFPLIVNTLCVIVLSLLIALPLGVGAAIYLTEYATNQKLIRIIEYTTETLAGIPSIIYGLVGMLILVPAIRNIFHIPDGASLLAAIVVLAIMVLPSIIKVSLNALDAVPKEYEEASLALGATPVETYFKVSVPAAKSGIAAAIVLGVGRAIGEAMAVMMVSGNVPNMPSLFQSVRFLTTAVASEMSYSSGLQRQALFSIALVLFFFIMLINATLNFFLKRKKD